MEIHILRYSEGAARASGIAVIIDVFRAFSVQGYAYARGARRIYTIGDLDLAYRLKAEQPDRLLVGERHAKKLEGFDFGNSPHELLKHDLRGKTLVHTSSAGTQGILAAKGADEVLVGALTNAAATARYIRSRVPAHVSLVCMGFENTSPADEDEQCALYIKALLTGADFDREAAVKIMRDGTGSRFFEPERQSYQPREDFDLCTRFDLFDFIMPVAWDENGVPYTKKQEA